MSLIWPDPQSLAISDHQKQELAKATCTRIGILAGAAGCGKTFVVAQLIRGLIRDGLNDSKIGIAGPTGKSAVRITETMQASGLSVRAETIHSMLKVGRPDGFGEWGFRHNELNPLPFDVIVLDESSMIDVQLMKSLFLARRPGCHLLFTGDINQLPPVGQGAPLRDLIASSVCGYGELTEIKRNSGGIVEACAAIRSGERWAEGDNLTLVDATTERTPAEVMQLLEQCRAKQLDPVWDAQVICAVNSKSELSRHKLNKLLQTELNPSPAIQGTPFRLGDKIVCNQNGEYQPVDRSEGDEDVYVANGELGEVVEIEASRMVVRIRISGEEIVVPRGKPAGEDGEESATGCNWDLAYALSCHRMQGSEVAVAIVILDDYAGARSVCDRSWLYTGISRAKRHCYLIGRRHVADAMCRKNSINQRKTLLRERIQLTMAKSDMEGMF